MAQDDRETAIHEAAHAVVAHYYGGNVTALQLGAGVADGKFDVELRGSSKTRIGKLLITLAGAAAQLKLVPSARAKGRYHRDWAHDMQAAERYSEGIFIERHGRRPNPLERDKIDRAAGRKIDLLLNDPAIWAAICATANELEDVRVLDGDRFRTIVERYLTNELSNVEREASLDLEES